MPQFVMMCLDKPGSVELRMATRDKHLAYMGEHQGLIKTGGPLLSDSEEMCGSFLILDAPDRATVEALNANDPYTLAGLFQRVDIHAWRQTVGWPI